MTNFLDTDKFFYHGTRAEFDTFRPLSHFGSLRAAQLILTLPQTLEDEAFDFLSYKIRQMFSKTCLNKHEKKIIPVKLNLTNTYELQDKHAVHDHKYYYDTMCHHVTQDLGLSGIPKFVDVIFMEPFSMSDSAVISELMTDNLYLPTTNRYANANHLTAQRMIHYFETMGYDGFHYVNMHEDIGHISYVPFRPCNIIRQDRQIIAPEKPNTIITAHYDTDDIRQATWGENWAIRHEKKFHTQVQQYQQNLFCPNLIADKQDTKEYWVRILETDLLPKLEKITNQSRYGYHGLTHTEQVALYGIDIAIACQCDVLPVLLACGLHDVARTNDKYCEEHGPRAVPIGDKFITQYYPNMLPAEKNKILNAVRNHTIGRKAPDIISACLWDADRIRLSWEYGFRPKFFSTKFGLHLAGLDKEKQKEYIKNQNNMLVRLGLKTKKQITHEQRINAIQRDTVFSPKTK